MLYQVAPKSTSSGLCSRAARATASGSLDANASSGARVTLRVSAGDDARLPSCAAEMKRNRPPTAGRMDASLVGFDRCAIFDFRRPRPPRAPPARPSPACEEQRPDGEVRHPRLRRSALKGRRWHRVPNVGQRHVREAHATHPLHAHHPGACLRQVHGERPHDEEQRATGRAHRAPSPPSRAPRCGSSRSSRGGRRGKAPHTAPRRDRTRGPSTKAPRYPLPPTLEEAVVRRSREARARRLRRGTPTGDRNTNAEEPDDPRVAEGRTRSPAGQRRHDAHRGEQADDPQHERQRKERPLRPTLGFPRAEDRDRDRDHRVDARGEARQRGQRGSEAARAKSAAVARAPVRRCPRVRPSPSAKATARRQPQASAQADQTPTKARGRNGMHGSYVATRMRTARRSC